MKKFTLLLCFALYSSYSFASKELFNRYKDAVVKIILKENGKKQSQGTGFYLGNKGYIVTNAHVVESNDKTEIEIENFKKEKIKNFTIVKCYKKDIDLCLIKTNVSPKSFFKLNNKDFERGENIYVIGHSLGLDYSFTDGLISGVRTYKDVSKDSKQNTKLYQISAPISPGNSGGPIFTKDGSLVGVSTFVISAKVAQNLNFSITNKELAKYFKEKKKAKFYTLSELKKALKKDADINIKKQVADLKKEYSQIRLKSFDFKKKLKPTQLQSKELAVALEMYLPSKIFACKSIVSSIFCISPLKTVHIIELENAYGNRKNDAGFTKKMLNKFKAKSPKVTPKKCNIDKNIFNNFKKEIQICNTSVTAQKENDMGVKLTSVELNKDSYISIFTTYDKGSLKEYAEIYNRFLLTASNLVKNKSFKKKPSYEGRAGKTKLSRVKKVDPIINDYNVSGIVHRIYLNQDDGHLSVTLKSNAGTKTRLKLNIDINNYNLPTIVQGEGITFTLSGKSSLIEQGIKWNSYRNLDFKISESSTENKITEYKIHSFYQHTNSSRIYVIDPKTDQKVTFDFYNQARTKIDGMDITKGGIIKLASADIVTDSKHMFINPKKIISIKAGSGSKTSSPTIAPKRSGRSDLRAKNRERMRSKRVDRNKEESKSFKGVIKDFKYYNRMSDDKESIWFKLDIEGRRIEFRVKMKLSDKTSHTFPIVANGSRVKLDINLPKRKIDRYLSKGKFYLDPGEYKIVFSKRSDLKSSVIGNYYNHHVKDDYSYMRIKNNGKTYRVNIYDQKAFDALSKINPKRGCKIHIDGINFIEKNRYNINRNFQIKSLVCN